jgi:predicted phosphodiesterase
MMQILHASDLHLFSTGTLATHPAATYPPLNQLYSRSYPQAQQRLRRGLFEAADGRPSAFIISGDIVAFPDEAFDAINQEHYDYIESLRSSLPPPSPLLAILGNHDWDRNQVTNFRNTRFDTVRRILQRPTMVYYPESPIPVLFFLVETTHQIYPARGEIDNRTLAYLRARFDDGRNGRLSFRRSARLSGYEYDQAMKILVLHHYPLDLAAYQGRLSSIVHFFLLLRNWRSLIWDCRRNVDLFLFGHSHIPNVVALAGSVFIDCGSTLATSWYGPPLDAQFQKISTENQQQIKVESFKWRDDLDRFTISQEATFSKSPSRRWTLSSLKVL